MQMATCFSPVSMTAFSIASRRLGKRRQPFKNLHSKRWVRNDLPRDLPAMISLIAGNALLDVNESLGKVNILDTLGYNI